MKGRFCVKSSDGFWLTIDQGRDAYITDPRPPAAPTSFFGKGQALEAMTRFRLPSIPEVLAREGFETFEAMRAAGNPAVCWAPVPDPNP